MPEKTFLYPNPGKRASPGSPATGICSDVIVHYRRLPLAAFCFRRVAAASEAQCTGSIIGGLLPHSSVALLGLENHPRATQQKSYCAPRAMIFTVASI